MSNWNLNEVELNDNPNKKSDKDYKKVEYIRTPGAYKVSVNGVIKSEDNMDYTGSPYIEFTLFTEDGKKGRARFWSPRTTDKPKSAEFKRKMLKEFLVNCGVTVFDDVETAFKQTVGASLNVCFTSREYLGTNRESGAPEVKTAVDYKFSKKANQIVKYDPKYNKVLSSDDRALLTNLQNNYDSRVIEDDEYDDAPF